MGKLLQKMKNKINYLNKTYYFCYNFILNVNNIFNLFNKLYNGINNVI